MIEDDQTDDLIASAPEATVRAGHTGHGRILHEGDLLDCLAANRAHVEDIAVEPDPDTEAGRVIDARAPWVRRLTAVVVRGTESTDPPSLRMYAGGGV